MCAECIYILFNWKSKGMNRFGVERQSSIEKEPRTLSNNQIEFAREAALYVVKSRSNEEALTIFTQGLEPVVRCGGGGEFIGDFSAEAGDGYDENYNNINHNVRDIVTAPF